MNELPPSVKSALEKIRQSHKHYVDLKIINGRAYVYESTSLWDKKLKTIKKITKYIGRITQSGEFIASQPRNPQLSAAILKEPAEKIHKSDEQDRSASSPARPGIGKYDVQILKELSADGRMTLPELANKIGLSTSGAEWQRTNVEKKYEVKYLAELDLDKLGYLTYIILIKFIDKIPPINEIKKNLEQEKSVQLALLTQGEYDLVIYAVFSKYGNMLMDFYNMRSRILPNYDLKLYVAPFYQSYSFVPLRDSFFDMLSERVWARSKNQPKPHGDYLLRREHSVLKELNTNGVMDFTKIDSKYKLVDGSSRYTYHKLVESGVIKRITISMENINMKYILMVLLQKINHVKYMKDREKVIRHIIADSDDRIANRYALEGDIKVPEGILFILPILNDSDMESANDSLRKIDGMSMISLIATNILVGNLCYRKLEGKYTIQSQILKQEYGANDKQPDRLKEPVIDEPFDL
jgi:DNA-binding Lrp family transcriptional regulator